MSAPVFDYHQHTERGPKKGRNEDATCVDPVSGTATVVDGIGGNPRGDRAAAIAVDLLCRLWPEGDPVVRMRERYLALNRALLETSKSDGLPAPMGCVATTARVLEDQEGLRIVIGHVGDTRAFLFEADGSGSQLTRDHSAMHHQDLPEALAMSAPQRNLIARGIGLFPVEADAAEQWVDVIEARVSPGQLLLLCTDGISDYVDRGTVAAVVARHPQALEPLVAELTRLSCESQLRGEGGDNLGVAVLRWPIPPAVELDSKADGLGAEAPSVATARHPWWSRSLLLGSWAVVSTLALVLTTGLTVAHRLGVGKAATLAVLEAGSPTLPERLRVHCTLPDSQCPLSPVRVGGDQGPVALCGEWPDSWVQGAGPLGLALCGRLHVPPGGLVVLDRIEARGDGPERLVVDDGATLVFRGGDLRLDRPMTWSLGQGATLRLEGVSLDLPDLQVEMGPGATLDLVDSDLRLESTAALLRSVGEGAGLTLTRSTIDLGEGQLYPAATPAAATSSLQSQGSILRAISPTGAANKDLAALAARGVDLTLEASTGAPR